MRPRIIPRACRNFDRAAVAGGELGHVAAAIVGVGVQGEGWWRACSGWLGCSLALSGTKLCLRW